MEEKIIERLALLREEMDREHLAAYIIPSTDPHCGEYVPDHYQCRAWISGFTGSAGIAVVTRRAAALWTDSRYFIAAEKQLAGTGFILMRLGLPDTPPITAWIAQDIDTGESTEVGIDGNVWSFDEVESLKKQLQEAGGLTLRTNWDPFSRIWHDRPALPSAKIMILDQALAGESAKSKLARIRERLALMHADGMPVTTLDDIAWTLNLRGADVHCNPVFIAYLLIEPDTATLFVEQNKLSEEVKSYLKDIGVGTEAYAEMGNALERYGHYAILADTSTLSYNLTKRINCRSIRMQPSPIPMMKAVKNQAEIEGFRSAMVKDGVAMVDFLYWLHGAIGKEVITERTASEKLLQCRSRQKDFVGLSFDTIAGYQEHGAIVHYQADEESDSTLKPEGFLLLDSGAQYKDGTTDLTRTIPLGPITARQKHIYTLVLKGYIRLQRTIFPKGASGTQLDALARVDMWREGLNYLHGTGHGVGAFLNVHEGPHQIRMEWRPAPLTEGMIVTDEPGLYLKDEFGVRIENVLLTRKSLETDFGTFLEFETLTLCPIDLSCADLQMLDQDEKDWLNDYHKRVLETLSPHLEDGPGQWLAQMTTPIS